MRIVSWNVNGIKSAQISIRRYLLKEKPDVLCINELKSTKNALQSIINTIMKGKIGQKYDGVWNPCSTGAWHGTAILAKKHLHMELLSSKLKIKAKVGSTSKWLDKSTLKLSGRKISHIRPDKRDVSKEEIVKAHRKEGRILVVKLNGDYPIILVATYVPNSGVMFKDPLRRLAYRVHHWDTDLFNYLLKFAEDYEGRVIWCGDLNVIHHEEDVAFFKKRIGCAGVTHDERKSFDGFLQTTPFFDAWRYVHGYDEIAYSFYNAKYPTAGQQSNINRNIVNDGWRLDYFIVHDSLKDCIVDTTIDIEDDSKYAVDTTRVSDHLPISLYIEV